jgi:pimeloyl-ACP methyl ester carboxylesterase
MIFMLQDLCDPVDVPVGHVAGGGYIPRVLGVHGIAQQYGSGPELTRVWSDALRGGLEAAGFRTTADGLAETDVRVAFFGNLFRPKVAMAGGEPPYTPADLKPGPERDLLERWYEAAVEQEPSLGPLPGAMGPGTVAVQAMLHRLLRSRTFARVAQRGFIGNLKQVTAFLDKPDAKERALRRVADEITPDTQVVIGHSLGSVVVYEFLARFAPPQVELLVTVGSPLGIPNLVFERLTPAPAGGVGAWPGQVARWVNVADADDVVALRKQLAPLFPAPGGGAGVEDQVVDNGDEPHAISRYLNAEPTGAALGTVL